MEFIRRSTPKQIQRNGLIKATNSTSSKYITTSSSSAGGGVVITNYLPAYMKDGYFEVIDAVNFYNPEGKWGFFKREREEVTNEDGTIGTRDKDINVLTIEPDKLTLGDGNQVLTTKHFYIDENGCLHTPYNLISEGEIAAYSNGTTGGGGSGGTVTIIDNLISTASNAALSANQGRILKELIDTINTHTHSNKSVLDGITTTHIANWNTAYTNNHTHGINKNCEVYRLLVGNYGGIRQAETNNDILKFGDGDITLNANGRNLYLGGSNTQTVYIPTYFDNGDGTTTAQWNSLNGTQFYMQMPMRIALQSHNNTQPPIWTNSSVLCPSLNADKVDGYDGTALVNNVTTNGDNIVITKGTTSTNIKPNFATKAERLVSPNGSTYMSYYDTYVNLTGTGGNINLGAQQYKNNNYNIQFITNNGTADKEGTVFWNYINGTQFLTQVPHRINLQSANNTQPPIITNSTNICTNLNADLLDGYHAASFLKNTGNQALSGTLTIDGDLVVSGNIKASGEVAAYSAGITNGISNKIKTALANVENANSIDEIKTILINLREAL